MAIQSRTIGRIETVDAIVRRVFARFSVLRKISRSSRIDQPELHSLSNIILLKLALLPAYIHKTKRAKPENLRYIQEFTITFQSSPESKLGAHLKLIAAGLVGHCLG